MNLFGVITRLMLLATLVVACDYVVDPLEGPAPGPGGDQAVRRILIEDFTGHTCANCPSATAVAVGLQELYGEDRVIVVGVHVTDAFGAPVPPAGDGEFDTDFRTPAGDSYTTSFGIAFLPVGAVNRKEFNSSVLLGEGSWSSAVAELIDQPASLDLWFETFAFDSASGEFSTSIKAAVLNQLAGEHRITVYLTEDHVIADQIDNAQNPSHVHAYEHRHVLRDNLNGTWGETIIAATANAGDTLAVSYTYAIPGNVIDPMNCALVAYVHDATTNEIVQVAERKFQQ